MNIVAYLVLIVVFAAIGTKLIMMVANLLVLALVALLKKVYPSWPTSSRNQTQPYECPSEYPGQKAKTSKGGVTPPETIRPSANLVPDRNEVMKNVPSIYQRKYQFLTNESPRCLHRGIMAPQGLRAPQAAGY